MRARFGSFEKPRGKILRNHSSSSMTRHGTRACRSDWRRYRAVFGIRAPITRNAIQMRFVAL